MNGCWIACLERRISSFLIWQHLFEFCLKHFTTYKMRPQFVALILRVICSLSHTRTHFYTSLFLHSTQVCFLFQTFVPTKNLLPTGQMRVGMIRCFTQHQIESNRTELSAFVLQCSLVSLIPVVVLVMISIRL